MDSGLRMGRVFRLSFTAANLALVPTYKSLVCRFGHFNQANDDVFATDTSNIVGIYGGLDNNSNIMNITVVLFDTSSAEVQVKGSRFCA
jgi:hypothetical protein